ncbi:MAG: Hsp70 family protein [Deltaproteobacteria bacterium HGW-Deltaproteobacteria-21]|nr:MAG: Hsp70 family protein [Deltaproteobacteria bacterium HGW-Deltaproteobacteria-21]
MRLGIDFGTTRTVAAAAENGNYPICTFSWKGEQKEYIPSLVAAKDDSIFFGWEAAEMLNDPGVHVLRSVKRLSQQLNPEAIVEISPDFHIPLLDLLTLFLRHVMQMLKRNGNLLFRKGARVEVMVATPANAGSNQRYLTLEAFRRAGFAVMGAMNEPSASAVEFAHRYLSNLGPKSPKKYMVVYDLGGGTFDTSAVALAGRNFEVIGHEGIGRLGGDDFDEMILDMALEALGRSRDGLTPSDEARLLEECRERKEGLKANTRKMVVDPGPGTWEGNPVVIETRELYARCDDLVRQSIEKLEEVISTLRTLSVDMDDPRSLAAIYLVGGSVSFPPVARKIREAYGSKVKVSPFPHAATAIGLAIAADPEARISMRESISRHFGVWREQEQGKDKVFDSIFIKDRQVDADTGIMEATRTYRPAHNIGHFRYMECSSVGSLGEPVGDIAFRKETFFPYDPFLSDRKDLSRIPVESRPDLLSQEVTETYSYEPDGRIRVAIENRTAGYRKVFDLGLGTRN